MKLINFANLRLIVLVLFVFSIAFQNWMPFDFAQGITFSWLLGVMYFALSINNRKFFFSLKYVRKPVFALFVYSVITTLINLINYWDMGTEPFFNHRLIQNTILFWLISNDIIRNKNLVKWIFLSLILSVFLMSVLSGMGIGVEFTNSQDLDGSRFTFFGANANDLGEYIALSLIMLTNLLLERNKYFGNKAFWLIPIIPSILFTLSVTGSRGAIIIWLIGTAIQFLILKTSVLQKVSLLIIGGIVLVYGLNTISDSQVVQNRLEESERRGAFSNRLPLWENAINIFVDNPFFGVGVHGYETKTRHALGYHEYADTHNIFLYLLATSGIVGFIIFMWFISCLFEVAWFSYKINYSILPLVLFIAYIMVNSKSGGAINNKFYWLIAAIIFGMGTQRKINYREKSIST